MRLKQYMLCFLLFSICPIGHVAGLEDSSMRAKVGIVDLSSFSNEYLENLDSLKEARSRYQEIEAGLKEVSAIFGRPECLDSLSIKEEEALRAKYRVLMHDSTDAQTQIYQIMMDANKLLQNIASQACEIVAQERQLDCIVGKHSCWYIRSEEDWTYDITPLVIAEISKILDSH